MKRPSVRILIADDFPAIRKAVRTLLRTHSGVTIVGEASNYAETITQLLALRPDVLLLDLQMPAPVGFQPEKIATIAAELSCVVIAMSIWVDEESVELSRRLGASVKLDKNSLGDQLVPAVHRFAIVREDETRIAAARHQCFIYEGPTTFGLAKMAAIIKKRLNENLRCLYLNSPEMLAKMRAHLAVLGVDVAHELAQSSLVLSSELEHLVDERFDIERMFDLLRKNVDQTLNDGHKGLFAVGDIEWEFTPKADFVELLEYEWRLAELLRELPALSGICQYHANVLSGEALRDAVACHDTFFVNDRLSRVNPKYVHAESLATLTTADRSGLDDVIAQFCVRDGR